MEKRQHVCLSLLLCDTCCRSSLRKLTFVCLFAESINFTLKKFIISNSTSYFFKNLQFSPSCLAWHDSKNNLIAQTVLLHYGHQMSPLYKNTAQPFFKFPINYRYLKLSFSLSKVIGDLLLLNKIVFHRPKVLLITCR